MASLIFNQTSSLLRAAPLISLKTFTRCMYSGHSNLFNMIMVSFFPPIHSPFPTTLTDTALLSSSYSSGYGSLSKDTVNGINILKAGQDPPIQPDSEYPDWLWDLTQRDPTIEELLRKHDQTGGGLSAEELKRYAKLLNRKKIKANNAKTSL